MAYRHSSGAPSNPTSAEFTAPSLHPFSCGYRCDADVEFVQEFLEAVLLTLMKEKWEYTEERHTVDLTAQANDPAAQAASTSSSSTAAGQSAAASPAAADGSAVPMRTGRLSVENVIITQLDAILRHPSVDKHFAVEIKSVETA
jgi:hypothetical protein